MSSCGFCVSVLSFVCELSALRLCFTFVFLFSLLCLVLWVLRFCFKFCVSVVGFAFLF